MSEPDDRTLPELRAALAPLLPAEAAFDGWTETALAAAAERADVPADRARLAFPDGAAGMIDAWFAEIDRAMAERLPPDALAALRVRDRITALVTARLEIAAPDREALRRALAVLARPANAAHGAALAWRAADAMWRLAGDTTADGSHYTKRATLLAVYGATLLVFLQDEGEEFADTRAFLARRIDGVMRLEAAKARWRRDPERRFSAMRFLGRLRYPAR